MVVGVVPWQKYTPLKNALFPSQQLAKYQPPEWGNAEKMPARTVENGSVGVQNSSGVSLLVFVGPC